MAEMARGNPEPENEGRRSIPERWAAMSVPILMALGGILNFALYHEYDLLAPEMLITVAILFGCGLILGLLIFAIRSDRIRAFTLGILLIVYCDVQFDLQDIADLTVVGGSKLISYAIIFLCFSTAMIVLQALRMHAAKILASAFAVILVTTFLFPPVPVRYGPQAIETDAPVEPDLPSVVHLVLDGHIGVEGIPQDIEGGPQLRQALIEFYLSHGFRLFGRTYSRYFNTRYSIASLLNPESARPDAWLRNLETNHWALNENQHFDELSDQGYAIRVYETEYFEYCREARQAIEYCYRYSGTSPQIASDKEISIRGKSQILIWSYLGDSVFFHIAMRLYDELSVVSQEMKIGVLPPRTRLAHTFSSLDSLEIMDRMTADIGTAPNGRVFFGHVMLPHAPFVFESDCRLRSDTSDWLDQRLDPRPLAVSTPDYRQHAYVKYFDQVRCLMLALTRMFEALKRADVWEEATIILHGDHGSRITLRDPIDEHLEVMSARDMIDAYSAFYAIRLPGIAAGYDLRTVSIQDLFAEQIFGLERETDELVVYSAPGRRYGMRRVPMVPIPPAEPTSSQTVIDGPQSPASQSH